MRDRCLADGGVMVLSFEAQKPYVADRMASVLREVFGAEPLHFRVPPTPYGWGGLIFVAGDQVAAGRGTSRPTLRWPPRSRNGKLRSP